MDVTTPAEGGEGGVMDLAECYSLKLKMSIIYKIERRHSKIVTFFLFQGRVDCILRHLCILYWLCLWWDVGMWDAEYMRNVCGELTQAN